MGKKIINLTGQRFGRLTVLEFAEIRNKVAAWKCLCSCGNTKIISGSSLRKGVSKSCGCINKEITSQRRKKESGTSAFNILFYSYKKEAKKRNLSFELSSDFFKKITQQSCFYCGIQPNQISKTRNNGYYIYNGIDRIDSSKNYTEDNVVPCCGTCNKAKYMMTQDEFLLWVKRIYNYSILKINQK